MDQLPTLSLSRVSHRSDTLSQLKQPYSFSDYPLSLSPASRTAFEVFGSIQWTIPLFPPSEVPANRSSDGPATSADHPPSPHCLHHSDSLPDSKNLLHEVLQPAAPRRATLKVLLWLMPSAWGHGGREKMWCIHPFYPSSLSNYRSLPGPQAI